MLGKPAPVEREPLTSYVAVNDETARTALRDFFAAVLEADGPSEIRRLAQVFGCQIETAPGRDWADNSGDGALKVDTPGMAMAAVNGQ